MTDLLADAGLTKADVDRLGEALRHGRLSEAQILDFRRYRGAFRPALSDIVAAIRAAAFFDVTQRQKTLRSTVAKLRRETSRLSQIQDIAGCRVVVPAIREQEQLTVTLLDRRPDWRLYDRREHPSHGYRAVHIVAFSGALPVEVQIRTELQHSWAVLSEAWDRRFEGVKYGRGPANIRVVLDDLSKDIMVVEQADSAFFREATGSTSGSAAEYRQKAHTELLAAVRAAFPAESPPTMTSQ